jgi:hypothetical protein
VPYERGEEIEEFKEFEEFEEFELLGSQGSRFFPTPFPDHRAARRTGPAASERGL